MTPLDKQTERLNVLLDNIESGLRERPKSSLGNSNTATIQVNAGGLGLWVAVCLCSFMAGLVLMGSFILVDQQRKISDLGDYLSAIYMQAPHLKPPEKDDSQ